MNPSWAAFARRNWPVVLAILVLAVFSVLDAVTFRPVLRRYRDDLRQAAELGMPLDPDAAPPGVTGPMASLLTDNSLLASVAEEQGDSGILTNDLADALTRLCSRSGLAVVATERGLVTQLPGSVQVRVHLRLHGSYAAFARLLDGIAGSRRFLAVDRFSMAAGSGGQEEIDAWFSQVLLKRRSAP